MAAPELSSAWPRVRHGDGADAHRAARRGPRATGGYQGRTRGDAVHRVARHSRARPSLWRARGPGHRGSGTRVADGREDPAGSRDVRLRDARRAARDAARKPPQRAVGTRGRMPSRVRSDAAIETCARRSWSGEDTLAVLGYPRAALGAARFVVNCLGAVRLGAGRGRGSPRFSRSRCAAAVALSRWASVPSSGATWIRSPRRRRRGLHITRPLHPAGGILGADHARFHSSPRDHGRHHRQRSVHPHRPRVAL